MAVTPQIWLQLVRADGTPLTSPFLPQKQRHGSVAIPLVEAVLARVGWWRTKPRLEQAIHEAIQALKDDARLAGG